MTMNAETRPRYDPLEFAEWVRKGGSAILAMQSGGCARYLLSSRVHYHVGVEGVPRFRHDPGNEHVHRLLTHSTMSLIIDLPPPSTDQIVLTGELREDSTGMDDGPERGYRFMAQRARVARESGEKIPLDVSALLRA